MNQRGFPKGGQEKLRSDFQIIRRGQSSCYVGCCSDGEGVSLVGAVQIFHFITSGTMHLTTLTYFGHIIRNKDKCL